MELGQAAKSRDQWRYSRNQWVETGEKGKEILQSVLIGLRQSTGSGLFWTRPGTCVPTGRSSSTLKIVQKHLHSSRDAIEMTRLSQNVEQVVQSAERFHQGHGNLIISRIHISSLTPSSVDVAMPTKSSSDDRRLSTSLMGKR